MNSPISMKSIRKWFLAGLLVIVPLTITIMVLRWIVDTLDQTLLILPTSWQPDTLFGFHIPGLGLIFSAVLLLVVGAIASNYFGKQLLAWWDSLLNRIPFVRSIYSSVKQVSDTVFSDSGNAFRQAVLVPWPHAGMQTIGFITGTPRDSLQKQLHVDSVSVYVPTTPNPTGGYFVLVPKKDVVDLDMSVDEALKYIISMGVVSPTDHLPLNTTVPEVKTPAPLRVSAQ